MADYVKVYGPLNTGVAAGGAGVATNNATSTVDINGAVFGVYIQYNDSPPAGTTDVTIATAGTSPKPPALTLLTVSNAATDGYFYPRVEMQDNTGSGLSTYDLPLIADKVKVTIAQANNGDSADVWVLYI